MNSLPSAHLCLLEFVTDETPMDAFTLQPGNHFAEVWGLVRNICHLLSDCSSFCDYRTRVVVVQTCCGHFLSVLSTSHKNWPHSVGQGKHAGQVLGYRLHLLMEGVANYFGQLHPFYIQGVLRQQCLVYFFLIFTFFFSHHTMLLGGISVLWTGQWRLGILITSPPGNSLVYFSKKHHMSILISGSLVTPEAASFFGGEATSSWRHWAD